MEPRKDPWTAGWEKLGLRCGETLPMRFRWPIRRLMRLDTDWLSTPGEDRPGAVAVELGCKPQFMHSIHTAECRVHAVQVETCFNKHARLRPALGTRTHFENFFQGRRNFFFPMRQKESASRDSFQPRPSRCPYQLPESVNPCGILLSGLGSTAAGPWGW